MKFAVSIGTWIINITIIAFLIMLFAHQVTFEAHATVGYPPAVDQTAIAMAVTEAIYYGYNNKK